MDWVYAARSTNGCGRDVLQYSHVMQLVEGYATVVINGCRRESLQLSCRPKYCSVMH